MPVALTVTLNQACPRLSEELRTILRARLGGPPAGITQGLIYANFEADGSRCFPWLHHVHIQVGQTVLCHDPHGWIWAARGRG